MASPRDLGIYVLQVYADQAGLDKPAFVQHYLSRYGDQFVANLGTSSQGVSWGDVKPEFRELAQSLDDPSSVSQAALATVLLKVGGQVSFVDALITGGTASVEQAKTLTVSAFSGLKWMAVLAAAVGVIY